MEGKHQRAFTLQLVQRAEPARLIIDQQQRTVKRHGNAVQQCERPCRPRGVAADRCGLGAEPVLAGHRRHKMCRAEQLRLVPISSGRPALLCRRVPAFATRGAGRWRERGRPESEVQHNLGRAQPARGRVRAGRVARVRVRGCRLCGVFAERVLAVCWRGAPAVLCATGWLLAVHRG